MLPWSMAAIGAIIGLPMFFEIGLVLLMPVIFLVAKRAERSIIALGIPALAGLSAMHGFVPPHPGPLAAIAALSTPTSACTLALGILVAIPTIVVAGPLFARFADALGAGARPATSTTRPTREAERPAQLRRDAGHGAAAGRADDGQGVSPTSPLDEGDRTAQGARLHR